MKVTDDWVFDFRQQGGKSIRYFIKMDDILTGKKIEKVFDDVFGLSLSMENKTMEDYRAWLINNTERLIQ